MKPLGGVILGIDTGVVGSKVFHLIEAMFDRVGARFVAQMPFAREVGRIAVFLENSAIVGVSL